jgi:hypothetical protein
MFSSTMLTLLFVPVFYLLVDDIGDFVKRTVHRVFGERERGEPLELDAKRS